MKRTLLAAALSFGALAHADAPKKQDFAYGIPLTPTREATFHRFPLRADAVLRLMTSPDLKDLCVFDADGVPKAHAIVWPQAGAPSLEDVSLASFPLEISRDTQGMEVKVERDASGQIIRTLSQPLVQQDARLRAYLLDAHTLEGVLTGLKLSFSGTRDTAMLPVRIESSEDLTTFSELAHATVGKLQHDGAVLERDFVALPRASHVYLRISFDPGTDAIALERAVARVERAGAPAAHETDVIPASASDSKDPAPQVFRFLIPHGVRPDRYQIRLPAGTTLAQGSLYGANSEDAPLLALDRQVYRAPPASYPLDTPRLRVAELRIDDVGGGIHGGAPQLELRHVPPVLLFAGDGKPPFTLAFASTSAQCTPLAGDTLTLEASPETSVRAGRGMALGGPDKLTPVAPGSSARAYALWAALLFAVAVLGVITRRLLRSV